MRQAKQRSKLYTIVPVAFAAMAIGAGGYIASSAIGQNPANGSSPSWACVTTAPSGGCQFGTDPQITGASGDPYADQNVWSPIPGYTQSLSANSPGDFQVVANGPVGNSGVVAYPNAGADYSGVVDNYSQVTSSFTESMPHNAQTSAWAMYDNWYNNWNDEVMIQYDFTGNGDCTAVATAQFGGSNGVPLQAWHLCDFTSPGDSGHTLDWKLGAGEGAQKQSESSGSIDIKAMTAWLENHTQPVANGGGTYLPAASTFTAISDGWEICSTGGQNETFQVSSFSAQASAGSPTTTTTTRPATTTTTVAPTTTTTSHPATTTTTTTHPATTTTTTTHPATTTTTTTHPATTTTTTAATNAVVVSRVAPGTGPTSGGTSVTISGTGLSGATAVHFGSVSASILSDSATSLTATAPPSIGGSVDVTVTTTAGTSQTTAVDQYTYIYPKPVITSISPSAGAPGGGSAVTITGSGFTGATTVSFGSSVASFTVLSTTSIAATEPAGSATSVVDVTVTGPGGTSRARRGRQVHLRAGGHFGRSDLR